MSDEPISSNSSGDAINPRELPPPIFEQYLSEVEEDEFDLISKQMDKLIELKQEIKVERTEIKSDKVIQENETIKINKEYVLSVSKEIPINEVDGFSLSRYFCKLKSITSGTSSDGISKSDVGKYFFITSEVNYHGVTNISSLNIEHITRESFVNGWNVDSSDLIIYTTSNLHVKKLLADEYQLLNQSSSQVRDNKRFFSIMNEDCEFEININKIDKITNNKEKLKILNSELYEALVESFPQERYGVFFDSLANYNVRIHYPHINIKNSNKESKDLKDIVVNLSFNTNHQLTTMGCMKTTFSFSDVDSSTNLYTHSHARRVSISSIMTYYKNTNYKGSEFCLGTATAIANQVSILKLKKSSFNEYWGFLNSIEPYLEWESLEGVPYNKIRDCKNLISNNLLKIEEASSKFVSILSRLTNITNHSLLNDFFDKTNNFDCFIDTNGKFIFKLNTSDYKKLKEMLIPISPCFLTEDQRMMFDSIEINGQYYYEKNNGGGEIGSGTLNSLKTQISSLNDSKCYLKLSDEINLPVKIEDENVKENSTHCVYPGFLKHLEDLLNERLNLIHFR